MWTVSGTWRGLRSSVVTALRSSWDWLSADGIVGVSEDCCGAFGSGSCDSTVLSTLLLSWLSVAVEVAVDSGKGGSGNTSSPRSRTMLRAALR